MKRETMIFDRYPDPAGLANGQVILFEQYRLFRRTWWWILLVSLAAAAGAAYYAYEIAVPEFKAVAVAVPPKKSGTPLDNLVGGLGSSLKDAAIGKLVGGGMSEGGYTRAALMTSRTVFDSLIAKYDLMQEFELPAGRKDIAYGILAERVEVEPQVDGPIIVAVYDPDPKRAADMANDLIRFTNAVARELNRKESEPITSYVGQRYEAVHRQYDSVLTTLTSFLQRNRLYAPEEQGSIIGTALSKAEADVMRQRSTVTVLTGQLGVDDPRTQLEKQILEEMEKQTRRMAAGSGGVVPGVSIDRMPKAAVEYAQLQVDFEKSAKTLAILEPMYEQMKLEEIRNIPILNILDPAFPPPLKARPKRSLLIAGAFVGTFIAGYLILAFAAYARGFNRRYRVYRSNGVVVQPTEEILIEERRR